MMSEKVTLRKKGQLTIPKSFIEALELSEGETLDLRIEDGKIIVVPTISITKEQAWFWSKKWQQEEMEVEKQVENGQLTSPMNLNESIQFLDSLKKQ